MNKSILILLSFVGLNMPVAFAHVDGSDLIACQEHREPKSKSPSYLFSEIKSEGFYAVLPHRELAFRRQIVEISSKIPVHWKNHTDLRNVQINFQFSLFDGRMASATQATKPDGLGRMLGFNFVMTNPDGKTSRVATGSSPFAVSYALVRVSRDLTILGESEHASDTQALICRLVVPAEFDHLVKNGFLVNQLKNVKTMEEFLLASGLVKLKAEHISGEPIP